MSGFARRSRGRFGGKSRCAAEVWARFGVVENYVEAFFGSGAVLLGAPRITPTETVNDIDGFVANVFRAIAHAPDEVARWADSPSTENDLHGRHAWLVARRADLTARLEGDPDYYDAKIAGWWLWGIASWIGSGWCAGVGPWHVVDGLLVRRADPAHEDDMDPGTGVKRRRLHLGDASQGVRRQLPRLGPQTSVQSRCDGLIDWMQALCERLRRVRVCCGDWLRVCGPTPTTVLGLTAVFLDPPYSEGERDMDIYARDSGTVAADVRAWAIEHGDDPLMRIALCGYDTEHAMPAGWSVYRWKTQGGYANQGEGSNDNAARETIWFSPHCLAERQGRLFGEAT